MQTDGSACQSENRDVGAALKANALRGGARAAHLPEEGGIDALALEAADRRRGARELCRGHDEGGRRQRVRRRHYVRRRRPLRLHCGSYLRGLHDAKLRRSICIL